MKMLRVFKGGKCIFKNLNSHYRRKRQSEKKIFQNELIYGNYFSRVREVKEESLPYPAPLESI